MSDVTLSKSVRSNLLSLQSTAELLSKTQVRLATGKKVNTALDSPTNFFTSKSLNNRASDLGSLLDAIGQGVKTIEAADRGLSALTKLVENAKSLARQARIAAEPRATYQPAGTTGNVDISEVLGTTTSTANTGTGAGGAGDLVLRINGTNTTIPLAANLTTAQVRDAINTALGPNGLVVASLDSSNNLVLTAANSDVDFRIDASSTDATTGALGLNEGTDYNSTNLLDRVGGLAGQTITLTPNGGSPVTLTFGSGVGQVSRFSELAPLLAGTGITASSIQNGANRNLSFTVASNPDGNAPTLAMTGSAGTTLGLSAPVSPGPANPITPSSTRASLERDYNDLLTQITQLAQDASYNGVNILDGDDLRIVLNESGDSFIEVEGVRYGAAGLGLLPVPADHFQTNSNLDALTAQIDTALTTLRSHATRLGSNLTSIQTREKFTKEMITTLKSGADALVLADVNEEGANMLALQTRQQLSQTALSLSAQADQSVLRLFG